MNNIKQKISPFLPRSIVALSAIRIILVIPLIILVFVMFYEQVYIPILSAMVFLYIPIHGLYAIKVEDKDKFTSVGFFLLYYFFWYLFYDSGICENNGRKDEILKLLLSAVLPIMFINYLVEILCTYAGLQLMRDPNYLNGMYYPPLAKANSGGQSTTPPANSTPPPVQSPAQTVDQKKPNLKKT